jgi:MoxR-like ATPase
MEKFPIMSLHGSLDTASKDDDVNLAEIEEKLDIIQKRLGAVSKALGQFIYGQDDVIEKVIVTVLAGGHGLLVGMPGMAKTRIVSCVGQVFGLDTKRVQFTPDLMPGDIIGSEILDESDTGKRSFRFVAGPIFSQMLMADEINRASPRTQSALLQAMQEDIVTVAGQTYDLPAPFHVLATQNPLEQEGTYPLPEAQLDRFLMEIDIFHPSRDAEKQMLLATTGPDNSEVPRVMTAQDLAAAQQLIRRVPVGGKIVEAILDIVRQARPQSSDDETVQKHVVWGPGPRASQALMLAVRARAVMHGRLSPSLDDVAALALPILKHRMALSFSARAEGIAVADVIRQLVARLD